MKIMIITDPVINQEPEIIMIKNDLNHHIETFHNTRIDKTKSIEVLQKNINKK